MADDKVQKVEKADDKEAEQRPPERKIVEEQKEEDDADGERMGNCGDIEQDLIEKEMREKKDTVA